MPAEDTTYPADWLRIAERDLARVETCLVAGDPELAGFCLQQAVEKFLKAYLLSQGWALRRIRDLEALLDDALRHTKTWEQYRAPCQQITKFYMLNRYPLPTAEPPAEDVICHHRQAVLPLIDGIRKAFGRPSAA